MTFKDWLNKFINDNELDREYVFRIEHGVSSSFMKFDVVINSIIALPAEHQQKIKNRLMAIESENGDILHYLNYVAEGFVKYKT